MTARKLDREDRHETKETRESKSARFFRLQHQVEWRTSSHRIKSEKKERQRWQRDGYGRLFEGKNCRTTMTIEAESRDYLGTRGGFGEIQDRYLERHAPAHCDCSRLLGNRESQGNKKQALPAYELVSL